MAVIICHLFFCISYTVLAAAETLYRVYVGRLVNDEFESI